MVKVEKINNEFIMTITSDHSIVDDCFLFGSQNAPSEGKKLIMEMAGEAYENYVRTLDHEDKRNKEYFDKEFSIENSVKPTDKEIDDLFPINKTIMNRGAAQREGAKIFRNKLLLSNASPAITEEGIQMLAREEYPIFKFDLEQILQQMAFINGFKKALNYKEK